MQAGSIKSDKFETGAVYSALGIFSKQERVHGNILNVCMTTFSMLERARENILKRMVRSSLTV